MKSLILVYRSYDVCLSKTILQHCTNMYVNKQACRTPAHAMHTHTYTYMYIHVHNRVSKEGRHIAREGKH